MNPPEITYTEIVYAFQRLYPEQYKMVVDVLSFCRQAQAQEVEDSDGNDGIPDG